MIVAGDFLQIPPVPNELYSDSGLHAFNSSIWQKCLPHKVCFTEIFRQSEVALVKAVNELEAGYPSDETNALISKLSRPIPISDETVFLFGTNFEVNCHNSQQFVGQPGDSHAYTAQDKGDVKLLDKLNVPKILCLKVGCPVILLRNLSPSLVNGSLGTVLKIHKDGPEVQFSREVVTLHKETFTQFDAKRRCVLAQRDQIPLNLAYSLTTHKSQGMSLPSVVVDCRHFFFPGQLGVAVGRATHIAGLQVVNYRRELCIPHPAVVVDYCSSEGEAIVEDFTCCKKVLIMVRTQ